MVKGTPYKVRSDPGRICLCGPGDICIGFVLSKGYMAVLALVYVFIYFFFYFFGFLVTFVFVQSPLLVKGTPYKVRSGLGRICQNTTD